VQPAEEREKRGGGAAQLVREIGWQSEALGREEEPWRSGEGEVWRRRGSSGLCVRLKTPPAAVCPVPS